MQQFYCFLIKRHFRPLMIVIVLLLGQLAVNGQCYTYSLNIFKVSPTYEITSPTWVTLQATMDNEFAGQQNMSWGRIYWYTQETGGEPFSMTEIATNQWSYSSTAEFNATWNMTVWVAYYDYWTNCETQRIPYEFPYLTSTPPTPPVYLNWEYGYVCGNVARFKVNSNATPVLYKQSALGGNNYDYITSSGTGFFEIPDYNPNTQYYVGASNGITSAFYGVSFDYFSNQPLPVTGTKTILSGNTTTLSENSGNNFSNIRWYDAGGNLVYDGVPFTTPVLTANTTYSVRGFNNTPDGGTCVTEPSYVTIQVNQPPPPVTCDLSINVYQSNPYPPYALCSPQTVTLTAEMDNPTLDHDRMAWGAMKFYYQETGGDPFSSQEVATNVNMFSRSIDVYANTGVTVWVSYKDYWTGCESPRTPYEFYVNPTPYLYVDYAYACGNVAKVKVNSNAAVVVYKQSSMGGNNYEQVMYAGSGAFEISNYEPGTSYYLMASSTCNSQFYPLSFDVFPTAAPPVTGNTTLPVGGSTTLTADNGTYYDYKWYDANGNFLHQGNQYTTPSLTENAYAYTVRAVSDQEICISDPTTVTVTVNLPVITYSPLNSSNFSKTVDLSKPVGTVKGEAGTSPEGAATYTIPIFASPGTNGISPSVSLSYSSMAGNGVAGFGWNLNGLSVISRIGKNNFHNGTVTPVTNTDEDVFILDGNRLEPISGANGADQTIYATEVESFAQIKSFGGTTANPDWFQVTDKDGSISEYGRSTDSRFLTDDGVNVTFWRLNKIIDINGNYVEFKYRNGYRDSRIDEINYTGNATASLAPYNKIKFNYEVRSDEVTTYSGGASFKLKHLINSITISNEGNTVKTYQFKYGYDNLYSMLNEVIETGSDGTSLNSTAFAYSAQQPSVEVMSSEALDGPYDYFSGDFNGDGKTDLLAARLYYQDGIKYHDQFELVYDMDEGMTYSMYVKALTPGYRIYGGGGKSVANFLAADYDGDGRDDVMEINTQRMVAVNFPTRNYLSNIKINLTREDPNGLIGYTEQPFNYVYSASGGGYRVIEPTNGSFLMSGDFDGDGNQDFITIRGKNLTTNEPECGCYKAFFTSPSTGIFDQVITGLGIGGNITDEHYTTTIANGNFTAIDFDGDGKQEVMVTTLYGSWIFSVKKTGTGASATFSASQLLMLLQLVKSDLIYPGDFNGDGKTDLLVRSGGWKVLYSTGKDYITSYVNFNRTVNITGSDGDDKIVVGDFNGDGKTDILHGYRYNTTTARFSLYYSNGNINNPFVNELYDYTGALALTGANFTSGDFNGDGKSDLLNKPSIGANADFIAFKPKEKEHLLTKVTNGHIVTNTFEYKALADKESSPIVYNRTIAPDDPANRNGFNYVQLPMYVVSSFSGPNGIGGISTTRYSYENAVVHRLAKGFLGFRTIVAENATTGIKTTIENRINTTFATPYTVKRTSQLLNNTYTSITSTDVSFIGLPLNSANPKRYTQHIDKSLEFDYVTGIGSETANQYDDYGNVLTSTVKTGAFLGTVVTPTHTTTTTSVFATVNTPVPARATSITASLQRNGMPVQSKITTFSYMPNGLPATKTEFSGLPKAVTTTYTYDQFGNVASSTISAAGINNRVATITYDAKGRLPVTKQQGVAGNMQTETATYDYKWGTPLTQTSASCLTSSFEYDGFGRVKRSTLPAGYSVSSSMIWDVQGESVYYTFTDYPGGKADTKTWYDRLGREIKMQTAGFNNQWLTQLTTYNAKGYVYTKTNPYYSTETPIVTTNTYDNFNRIEKASNTIQTVDYSYTKLADGKLEQTVTVAGQSSSKTTDASGKVVKALDKGGQLTFTYDSWGNQTQVIHNGDILVTNTYDNYGKQTSTVEKNAGTVTYDYDALGQLKQQSDANGNSYTMAYDDFGRIISRQGPEGTTTFAYYKDPNTGCSSNSLSKIIGFNGVTKEYTFDNLKQVYSEIVTIDGTINTTYFDYDTYGNISKTTYPSGIVVNNVYDNNGNLTSVTGGDNAAPVTLFTGTGMNGFGQYTDYTLGNNRSTQNTFTNGYPTRFYTAGIQDLNFSFDYSKGNLTSRQDALKNLTETFGYDHLNRLTTTTVNNVQQLNIGYDGDNSFSRGNITSKTDAGDYVYRNDKIHAVAYITNPAGPTLPPITMASGLQEITYTPFLKTESITENNYRLDYVYGVDYERAKSILKQNNALIETKYYFGDYERQISGGVTREIHYVSGGNGICAIIVRENNVNSTYFTYTDYLGSLLTVTDINGNVVAEQNFDAWGRNRNAATWQYGAWTAAPAWLYRGYTGHEHLQQFALINMNGRLYDPIQGRMLSPDNYVGSPFGTQGYNRYSYGNNNPLAFVDPDGNTPLAAFAAVVAISSAISAGTYSLTAMVHGNWNWNGFLKAAAMGALSGAIGGTVAQVGISMGFAATSLGLNIISNVAAQVGTSIAFGNKLTFGMIAGSILGGAVAHGFGNYTGTQGGDLSNIVGELSFNTIKYATSGGISGALGAAFDGGDIGMGFMNGMRNGVIGGLALSSMNILAMGPTYYVKGIPDMGRNTPVFRTGTFLTRMLFRNSGLTLGRNLITNIIRKGGPDYNAYLQAHEYGHYLDLVRMGLLKFYQKSINEYREFGRNESYGVKDTNEYNAQQFAGFVTGIVYDIKGDAAVPRLTPQLYYKYMFYRFLGLR